MWVVDTACHLAGSGQDDGPAEPELLRRGGRASPSSARRPTASRASNQGSERHRTLACLGCTRGRCRPALARSRRPAPCQPPPPQWAWGLRREREHVAMAASVRARCGCSKHAMRGIRGVQHQTIKHGVSPVFCGACSQAAPDSTRSQKASLMRSSMPPPPLACTNWLMSKPAQKRPAAEGTGCRMRCSRWAGTRSG